ncbi:MAG: polyribonucleotide nucleotidyltransferase [Candidatus Cloacimonetes bacterium]|nr:polyribonucleotide nucleotidyltransferase [Candidatus Cloacimonadota bacterium]
MFNITKKSIELAGRTLTLETGHMARQANGSIFLTYGATTMLIAVTMSKEPRANASFFPLTVDFQEKMYAAGKVPGGFFKREARPSTNATLSCRLIDRCIRPLFPDGFRNDVHVVITILSYDGGADPAVLGIIGASAALSISDIPFSGPIAGASVGMDDERKLVLYPAQEVLRKGILDISVAGSHSSIVMIESGAEEVSEQEILEAIYMGHDAIRQIVAIIGELAAEVGKEKKAFEYDVVPQDILNEIEGKWKQELHDAVRIEGKQERNDAFDALRDKIMTTYEESLDEDAFAEKERDLKRGVEKLLKQNVRHSILYDHHRADGRGLDDIRPITCEVDVVPRVHGSALFTRGETQAFVAVTLGTNRDEEIIDGLNEEYRKPFYLHYNFPPFSVGEAGFLRGPGRREIGHGALAERSLLPMLPNGEDFPYTVRIVSEIFESNGSSSMASVCGGTLAMMAAGVPLKRPIAGIANGLILEGDTFVVLTDIMGLEDHLGDMDFKVAGSREGITSMQMDIKIDGVTREIMKIALEKALTARIHILDKIEAVLPAPRPEISEFAPQIVSFMIDPTRIGEVIGPQGKIIKGIIEKTGVQINIDDTGEVRIASPDRDSIDNAREIVGWIIDGPVLNEVYDGLITRTEGFGAFVEIMEGYKEGMIHISNLDFKRIRETTDLVKVGDMVKVRYIKEDNGRLRFSMKGIEGNPTLPDDYQESTGGGGGDRGGRDRGGRNDRGGRDRGRGGGGGYRR